MMKNCRPIAIKEELASVSEFRGLIELRQLLTSEPSCKSRVNFGCTMVSYQL